MTRLTAGCKVNLGLHVTGVRADGYHELVSLRLKSKDVAAEVRIVLRVG